jgi:hypothetical protein
VNREPNSFLPELERTERRSSFTQFFAATLSGACVSNHAITYRKSVSVAPGFERASPFRG